MNKHGNYVHYELSYPSYSIADIMTQSTAVYPNSYMQYYPITNPVYARVTPVFMLSEAYSAPIYLTHLKAIADHISDSDAKAAAYQDAKSKYENQRTSTNITPTVGKPPLKIANVLEQLELSAYSRDKQVTPTVTFQGSYPYIFQQDILMDGTLTDSEANPVGNDQEYINVVDIDEEDVTRFVPTSIANFSHLSKVLQDKPVTGGYLEKLSNLVSAFNKDSKSSSAPKNLILMRRSNSQTPPLSHSEIENNNDIYPECSTAVSSTATKHIPEQPQKKFTRFTNFMKTLQKSLDITVKKLEIKQPYPIDCNTGVPLHNDELNHITPTSSIALGNAKRPPTPRCRPFQVNGEEMHQKKKNRPIRSISEPLPFDETCDISYRKRPKQMSTDNSKKIRKHDNFQVSVLQRITEPYAREELIDCAVKKTELGRQISKECVRKHKTSIPATYAQNQTQVAAETQPSYAKRRSLVGTGPTTASSSSPYAASASDTFKTVSSYAGTSPVFEVPQPSPGIGVLAPSTSARPRLGLLSVSPYKLIQKTSAAQPFTIQVVPYVTEACQVQVAIRAPQASTSVGPNTGLEQSPDAFSKGSSEENHIKGMFQKENNLKRKFQSSISEKSLKHQKEKDDCTHKTYKVQKLARPAPAFVSIGARGTLIRQDIYDLILWEDCMQCTKLLMQFIFEFRAMATLSLDGPEQLDPDIVHDIATHVSFKCDVPVQQVLHIMRHICSVAKMCFEESNSF